MAAIMDDSTSRHAADEQTPLLPSNSPRPTTHPSPPTSKKNKRFSETYISLTLALAVLILGTGDELIQPAQTRVYESIYCRRYFLAHDPSLIGSDGGDGVAERFCKNHVIQGDVAMLKGWLMTIEAFVMLLVSVPWGYAADVWGRKPVLLLILMGMWFRAAWTQGVCWFWRTFPIEAVYGSSAFALLGGGSAIATAVVFTMLSDVIPEERRAINFFRIAGAAALTQVIGPLGSGALMKLDPWIPMFLGLVLQAIVVFMALAVPETKGYHELPKEQSDEGDGELDNASTYPDKTTPLGRLIKAAQDSIAFLGSDPRLLLLIPAFFMHVLLQSRDILLQYISTRYSKSLSTATFILSLRSAWICGFVMLLFPAISQWLRMSFKIHPQRSDLLLSRISGVVATIGFVLIALAPSIPLLIVAMVINTLGLGLHLFLRSLATSMVEAHHIARLMTFFSWADMIGLMLGSPFLAWVFERGVDLGSAWTGLPFLVCGMAMSVVTILIAMPILRVKSVNDEEEPLVNADQEAEERQGERS